METFKKNISSMKDKYILVLKISNLYTILSIPIFLSLYWNLLDHKHDQIIINYQWSVFEAFWSGKWLHEFCALRFNTDRQKDN